jgi:hypothetical protein
MGCFYSAHDLNSRYPAGQKVSVKK